jgi:hypothetical protein
MKNYILSFLVFFSFLVFPNSSIETSLYEITIDQSQNPRDRKLSTEEVKTRGLDLLANQVVENIDEIDLRKTARSAIFETSYGFRWKMVNLHTSKIIIVKVDKNFNLISARSSNRKL